MEVGDWEGTHGEGAIKLLEATLARGGLRGQEVLLVVTREALGTRQRAVARGAGHPVKGIRRDPEGS